ncbi:Rho guanine nucleotide exchange factor 4 [Apophysomyces sp. BC1015]|nr:Rho guanine nucleotide exchange factor 4 [Apophysomyces sp. BC1015]
MFCLSTKQQQYQELIHEIILTEKSYVADLILVYKVFVKDALVWRPLPRPVRRIFQNLFHIIKVHRHLVQDLERRQAIQYPISSFNVYSAYFVNFELANDVITRCLASKTDLFGVYLRNRTAWPVCRQLTLQSFLLKPIQRLMKYPLFFKNLLECLDPCDTDVELHRQVLDELESTIRTIEIQKKETEEFIKLADLATRIQGLKV